MSVWILEAALIGHLEFRVGLNAGRPISAKLDGKLKRKFHGLLDCGNYSS